jgi:GDP-L-fucose synthase
MNTYRRLLVTGADGFLAHHILPVLKRHLYADIITVSRAQYDLTMPNEPERMIRDTTPDCIIHLAGKSGGIVDNRKHPAAYFYDNLAMNLHTLDAACKLGVKKMVTFMGGCSYPATALSPIDEAQMWSGYPQKESAGYSVAKKMLITQSWAYRAEYGFNSIVLIPGNVYGEWDNFRLEKAHVIPALIRRFIEAGEAGETEVTALGSGRPVRDFVYAGDVAETIPWFIENYDTSEPINISAGNRIAIRELTDLIRQSTGFDGTVLWDTSQPDGQIEKIFDVTKLNASGLTCNTSLEEGVTRTVEWYKEARKTGKARL